MRIPFDLLAVLLGLEAVRQELAAELGLMDVASRHEMLALASRHGGLAEACVALLGFWAVVWLVHEGLARMAEWRTRWGAVPAGVHPYGAVPLRQHPLEVHARAVHGAQAFSVLLFLLFLWHFRWPLATAGWPEWFGLDRVLSPRACDALGGSGFIACLFNLGPFVVAMLLGWVPRRRLSQHGSGRAIRLSSYLSFEARLTFLPLALWIMIYLFDDLTSLVVDQQTLDAARRLPWLGVVFTIALLALFAAVLMPLMVVWIWQCKPLPDGDLKERLVALMRRGGVKARAILTWGPKGTGLANAAVLGPWAPMRFILISPGLAESLEPEECEAVLAHELGHARHGHLRTLVLFVIVLSMLSGLLMRTVQDWSVWSQTLFFLALLALYIRVFFGAISRACEREADLASAELVGSPRPLISALEKVGRMAGNIRDVYSWHHDSIARRVALLERDGYDPEAIRTYHKRLDRLRLAFLVFAVLSIGAELGLALSDGPPPEGTAEQADP
ncbi:MAG: M48 family metallopeptidase [Planctomycetota bacterium]|nr:M48 family metallopeptidase [Planctomycetota bacterium]